MTLHNQKHAEDAGQIPEIRVKSEAQLTESKQDLGDTQYKAINLSQGADNKVSGK